MERLHRAMTPWYRQLLGWLAVTLSAFITCFWALWGIIENFHEGWYYQSLLANLGLMLVQYLFVMLVFLGAALLALYRPRLGAGLYVAAALFVAWRFGLANLAARTFIIPPLLVLAALSWFGRPRPLRIAVAIVVGLPVLTLLVCGAEPAWRVAGRIDDGDLGARLVEGNGVKLIWAPAGPGWPDRGGIDWEEAKRRCRHLTADGTALADTPQNIWRLPTAAEAVASLSRHGENCGGTWDPVTARATYRVMPDKESPLWNTHSQVIYWWTATEVDAGSAYMVAYNGQVHPRLKRFRYFAFRAVKPVPAD
jgi:hypothetical protein